MQMPGDDFLQGVVDVAEEQYGIGETVGPKDVGIRGRPGRRFAGARLGVPGLIQGIAEEGIDRYVTPFLTDRIGEAAQGVASLVRDPSRLVAGTANINPYGFGGGF